MLKLLDPELVQHILGVGPSNLGSRGIWGLRVVAINHMGGGVFQYFNNHMAILNISHGKPSPICQFSYLIVKVITTQSRESSCALFLSHKYLLCTRLEP